jgi:tetratricopeptide (TPR) repeat protein
MRNSVVIIFLILLSFSAFAQKPKTTGKSAASANTKPAKSPETLLSESEEFAKAVATKNAAERIAALQRFIANFPQSTEKIKAQELIVSARAAIGDEKLRLSETESGVELFKLAVKDVPQPISDKFFSEILLQFPTNLFWRGQQSAALEIARMIEAKAEGNAKQLLGLATFYIGIENAAEAERLANKVIALNTHLPAAYQTLGLAYRVNFQLEESANAYAKALELDAESIVSKRSLAEMKRAVGKSDESAVLYREILANNESDASAQTGLALALFDAGKRAEAEAEMSKSLAVNPNNLPLLVGAAYWYAANNDGAKAVELAGKAVEIEPRYTWAHIALARGFTQQKRPLEAERTLLAARQYGNFPTLDYELASARLAAGFYREAADVLRRAFVVKGETIETRLGGRLAKNAKNFIELLDLERRASIFQPQSADNPETAEKLKSLLDFSQKLDAAQPDETEIAKAADEFVKGDDKMKLHRQLFAANRLLQSNKSLSKALEIAQSAVGKTDAALDIPTASAAVLADELYESRTLAATRNQLIIVPEVPRQTLSAVLRGRIEEISGWTLYQQNKPVEAAVHLKRAVSVLPEKSAWWNSSMWRLGASLQADGKDKEALNAYIKSFPKDSYDSVKYSVIESLYQKINGSTEGLQDVINAQAKSAPIIETQLKSTDSLARNTETASNKTGISTAQSADFKPSERLPAPQKMRFPKEVPVKIETEKTEAEKTETKKAEAEKSSEVVAATVIPANNEAKPDLTVEAPAEVKPSPNLVSEQPTTEKSNIIEAKPVDAEKPLIAEEKPIMVEEKPIAIEQPKAENKTTTENPANVERKLPIENSAKTENKLTVENLVETETAAATEVLPDNEKPVIYKNHFPPSPKTIAETKDSTLKIDAPKIANVQKNSPKPIFEPIIINIPKTDAEKTPASETSADKDQAIRQSISQDKNFEPLTTEKPKSDEVSTGNAATIKKPIDETIVSGLTRPRVFITENLPPATELSRPTIPPCTIVVGQENISLLGGGGSLGILVGFKEKGNLKELKAVSESPDDIEIIFDSEIGEIAGRSFFIVKSINTVKGSYKVMFEAPCGKKEIAIKVR